MEMIDKFPDYNNLNYTYAEQVYTAYAFYQNMSSGAVELVDKKYIDNLENYKKRIDELVEEAAKNAEEAEKKEAEEASKTSESNETSSEDSSKGSDQNASSQT
jgi:flagellar basal-body rod modification protein FlgD